jgi:hypothetical protein
MMGGLTGRQYPEFEKGLKDNPLTTLLGAGAMAGFGPAGILLGGAGGNSLGKKLKKLF